MKHLLTIFCVMLFLSKPFAQTVDKALNTIDVQGNSKMLANPPNYSANILIQEEEQKVGYTTIGKLSIDSIKLILSTNLKKFGLDDKELKILGISSKEIGQYPSYLTNIAYELKLKDKETANKLVNEMRFVGLKGIIIKRVFTQAQKNTLSDSLYNSAINDAKRIATEFAKRENKTIGEIKSIEFKFNSVTPYMDADTNNDMYNSYGYGRFEMDYRDKYATGFVRVIFEMK